MKLKNISRIFQIVALLAIQLLNPASAASHHEAPQLALQSVEFEGSGPVFDADGNLVAVDRLRFSGVTGDGHWIEGSGELLLPGPDQDHSVQALVGNIDGILGRVGDVKDGTSNTFMGRARVGFDSINVDEGRFDASGSMRLQLEILQPALVHEFAIVADAARDGDGSWSARFRGADGLGMGVRIEGFFDSRNQWGVWDDTDTVHLQGDVEALALLEPEADSLSFEDMAGEEQFVFDDTDGAERLYFVHDDRGRLSHIVPSAEVAGRFSARLTLPVIAHDAEAWFNIQVGDVIVSESEQTPDGKVSGRAEVFFSGVGERDGVAVTVNGIAEFHFEGDASGGTNSFLRGHWLQLNATLEDTATGGAQLFEDVSGSIGQARIVGKVDASGQVDLSGGLGQITALDQDLDT